MERNCPHCGVKMDVFDEACHSCGSTSKPGILLSAAAVIHGHSSVLVLVAGLTAGWFIMSWLFKW